MQNEKSAGNGAVMTRKEMLLHAVILCATCLLFHFFQQAISLNNGEGSYDGVAYAKMATDFRAGVPPQAELPFIYRLAVPFVVSLLPIAGIVKAFFAANLLASILSYFLFILWIKLFIRTPWVRIAIGLMFLLSFHSDLRIAFYHPVEVDQWLTVFLLSGLNILSRNGATSRRGILLMSCVAFFGTLVRESTVILPLAYLFLTLRLRSRTEDDRPVYLQVPSAAAFIPLLVSAAAIALTHYAVPPQPSFFMDTAFGWLYLKPLPDYLYGWFIAFGFIPLLFFLFPGTWWQEVRKYPEQVVLVGVTAALGYIGGHATYRILYWASPVILMWGGIVLERIPRTAMKAPMLLILAALQAYSQRMFLPLPDYHLGMPLGNTAMLLTPLKYDANIYDILGLGARECSLAGLTQYVIAYALLYLIFRFRIAWRDDR